MKIVHIAPDAPYNDNWGYQDNLLPKYQKQLGHEVIMIATNRMHKDGKIVETECNDYILNDGVRVIRRGYKDFGQATITGVLRKIDVLELLEELQPDFIFYHGLCSCTIYDVIRYVKRHPVCHFVEDNHMDYNIGNQFSTPKEKIVRAWLRFMNRKPSRYVSKVYGVTPWRKTYAEDYFHIPSEKTDVLMMGADDEKMDLQHKQSLREEIRGQYRIGEKRFLIVSGGKLDSKKRVNLLMRACAEMPEVTLLVFGIPSKDMQDEFEKLEKYPNIISAGWIDSGQVYRYFYAADLVFFPGQHSVLWEQACASKVPCVFGKWDGMDHVNNGGNSCFIEDVSVEGIKDKIRELCFTDEYFRMKAVAESEKTDIYLYSKIAKKSLECAHKAEQE